VKPTAGLPIAVALLAALGAAACAAGPKQDTVLLFHTNDLHGHVERLPTMAGIVKGERERRRDVLWLDAGDGVSGTPVSSITKGTAHFTVANFAGIDAACLGNHEFDYGFARIAKYREAAAFPLLCANARSPEGTLLGDSEWIVVQVDGVRVGVIGLLTEQTPFATTKRGNEGVRFEPAKEALERLVPIVREKCDLLVALTHVGYEEDVELARSVKGVDVIVGGHSHTDLPAPVQVGDTVVVQALCYGLRLGRLEVTVDLDARRMVKWEGKPLTVDPERQPRDAATAAAVAELEKTVSRTADVLVGTAERDLEKEDVKALAERVMRETAGADFGLQNDGGVRASIPKGPVTVRRIWEAFPFENTVVRVKVPGKALPPDLAKGAKVDPGKVYVVATNTFIADHLDRYLPGADPAVEDTGVVLRDAVVEWVKKHPELK
jgi:5'-nucleotidase/UDP-sugar diphosphatase